MRCLVHRSTPDRDDVEWVHGDLTAPFIGLSESDYADIVRDSDRIVHAGALTNFAAPVADICRSNVAGTRRVVEMARAAEVPLVHVSTAFVDRRTRCISCSTRLEADDDPDETSPSDGAEMYLNSKREGEEIVRDADIPHVIARPSIVLGDSRTGEIADFQGLHVMAGLVVEGKLPMLPAQPDGRVDFLPRDVVAAAIGGLAEAGWSEGEYWVTAGERAPTIEQVLDAAERFASRIGKEPSRPRIMAPDTVDRLIRPVFLDKLPEKVAHRLELLFALVPLANTAEPFRSSVDDLAAKLGFDPPSDLLEVFETNLAYWAQENELTEARA